MSTYVFINQDFIGYPCFKGGAMSNMQLNPIIVGEVIARYRMKKGITQEVLSGLSDIGRTHLSAIERGERKPTLETLYRISVALDIKMSVIVMSIEEEIEKNENNRSS